MTDFKNPKEIELMRKTVRKLPKNAQVIEIGSFKGRSTNIIADELKYSAGGKIHAIDPWEGGNTGWGNDFKDDVFALFKQNTKHNDHIITAIKKDSKKAHSSFQNESTDLIFIDGDHSYEGAKADIENYLPKIKNGGYILLHDALEPSVFNAIRTTSIQRCRLVDIAESLIVYQKLNMTGSVKARIKWNYYKIKKMLWQMMQ